MLGRAARLCSSFHSLTGSSRPLLPHGLYKQPALADHPPFRRPLSLRLVQQQQQQHIQRRTFAMTAPTRDVTHQTDITLMKTESDGSFKRAPSTFRNTIEKGGQFPPEKGAFGLSASPSAASGRIHSQ